MENFFPIGLAFSSGALIVLLKIIAIDIILSGDNAVVIAMATRNLPKEQQNKAIFWGTGGAVILRIIFAIIIVQLLKIPYVEIVGGLLLLWIAFKVLIGGEEDVHVKSQSGVMKAIGTIILADAIMSLDNVVALAGAANNHIGLIAAGVAISIPVMIFGSKMIVKAMNRFSWIAYIGSGILAWTAGEMLMKDEKLLQLLNISHGPITYIISALITIFILAAGYTVNRIIDAKREMQHQHVH
ncbi:TerC family protein [Heyndrickxia sporothermodurans]|uniref:TerC family protein n=1 Tax=Heyndrickxia sporothermodurans TaxID=46224 RepID=A0AB37HDK6_9BACI|nr:TerC family protein [Heyndrickxia sporothermodurans]MBL5767575.1 TerC family protein [Heyndrickxia sporothermodurans]MBL5770555.1 TerC family protein [Heyndrickxia sporothermodurans]MBL5774244.1 TerC family protein [Heyndrickxia sporothermodurans]MBL5777704.1 TerC family protein [Heyndrickxia sporothermodurans]MBL5781474.1 TerC family protein [Heyndrickxia sporothermodurans]